MKRILLFSIFFLFPISVLFTQSSIEVTSDFDFQLAVNYANQNNVDTIYLATSGGLYTTTDTNYFNITSPLVIMAKPGLAEMPTITHSDDSANVIEIFRISNDFTLEGVILDGGHAESHGVKYALRAGNGPDDFPVFKQGSNITLRNCVIRNVYQDKDPQGQGHALYFLKDVVAGTVIVDNCVIEDIGDEAIRMSETEKFATERVVDTLIVRNTTFINIDAECVRFYADADTATADAYVLLENLTINNSATRAFYIKNNQYAVARNIIVSNSRLPGADRLDRADYIMELQQKGSMISNIDTFNIVYGPFPRENKLNTSKGADDIDDATIFNFDPIYADAENRDYSLAANSPAHFSGVDNSNLGDSRWVNPAPSVSPLNVEIIGNGSVVFNPERKGLVFDNGTKVELTAVPDSGNQFVSWGGDLSGTDNPQTLTVDTEKNVTVSFDPLTDLEELSDVPNVYFLQQNYPNPFNPTTSIQFSIKQSAVTSLVLYDILGQKVKTLFEKDLKAGIHNYSLDASDLSSGLYLYQIQSGNFIATKKLMLLK